MIQNIHQGAHAKDVAQEDELLSDIGVHLTCFRRELVLAVIHHQGYPMVLGGDDSHPFLGCETNLSHKSMKVSDQGVNHILLTGVWGIGIDGDHVVGQSFCREI